MAADASNANIKASGLMNVGGTCFLNAALQMLLSLPEFVKTVLANEAYLAKTQTGTALYILTNAAVNGDPNTISLAGNVAAALKNDVTRRLPHQQYSGSNESASEAVTLLLDMCEPETPQSELDAKKSVNPLYVPLAHRVKAATWCHQCRKCVCETTDESVFFHLFSGNVDKCAVDVVKSVSEKGDSATIDASTPFSDPTKFAAALLRQVTPVDAYTCPECGYKGAATRDYKLRMVAESIMVVYNRFGIPAAAADSGLPPPVFPLEFVLPSAASPPTPVRYRLRAQVEHSGSLGGGHYWALAVRAGTDNISAQAYRLDDSSASPIPALGPTGSTYIASYHSF